MKKIFLPVLAFVGVGLGVALTSCGGGGGGAKISGTVIQAVGPNCVYDMYINEPLGDGATGAYYGSIADTSGFRRSNVMYSLTDVKTGGEKGRLTGCTGTIASDTLDQTNLIALFNIVWEMDTTNGKIVDMHMESAPEFAFDGEDPANSVIHWTGTARYTMSSTGSGGISGEKNKDVNRTDRVLYVYRGS